MLPPTLMPAWNDLLEAFRLVQKPLKVPACECPSCDLPESRILALLEIPPDRLEDGRDVRHYLANVRGTVGADEDLTFLLPGLTRIWAEKEVPDEWYQENFWEVLARGEFLAIGLSSDLNVALTRFLEATILWRLGLESRLERIKGMGAPHAWARDLGGFARVTGSLESLWNSWWSLSSAGHARSVLEYGSCIVFEAQANPFFAPQTVNRGGGPCLLELGERPGTYWREENLHFLRRTLTVGYLEAAFGRAVQRLEDPDEKARALEALDWVQRDREGVARRIQILLEE